MTSSNGNIFRVTGPFCGEFTGHRWIPLTKASDAELWCFLWSGLEQTVEQNNRDAADLRRHRAHYDVTVMITKHKTGWRYDREYFPRYPLGLSTPKDPRGVWNECPNLYPVVTRAECDKMACQNAWSVQYTSRIWIKIPARPVGWIGGQSSTTPFGFDHTTGTPCTSNIRHTKYHQVNVSRLVLQLPCSNYFWVLKFIAY